MAKIPNDKYYTPQHLLYYVLNKTMKGVKSMLESECHKTSFSNITIEITKCSNSSYFSSNGAGLVVTVKNLGCENRKVKHLFDKE